ncbi:MAG: sugar nucleotide-binding protein [Methanosarcinaceae archaeon]|nr:sugar nucleotide-binding protein [Methanosarcinaceae archaeon]
MEIKKKVFVTGSGGMVGSRFVELYQDRYKLMTPDIDELDLTDKKAVEKFVKKEKPHIIVHFAAFTEVSIAEKQRDEIDGICYKVNVEATKNLVEAIDPKVTHFVHISTDMVFSGSKDDPGPYEERHKSEKDYKKLTWYGYTKKVAEDVVNKVLGQNCSILRLIYPVRAGYDRKLDPQVRGRLKLFDEGRLYPLFDDQYISIADVDEVCQAIYRIIKLKAFGIFHAGSKDITTPYELGMYLIKKARGKDNVVKRGTLDEYTSKSGNLVRWPKYGGLKVCETEEKLGINFSSWRKIINRLIRQGI